MMRASSLKFLKTKVMIDSLSQGTEPPRGSPQNEMAIDFDMPVEENKIEESFVFEEKPSVNLIKSTDSDLNVM